ncbi:serine hydrolase domain-containing protein [Paraburkholderia oxyphila]|uniref:serine hydrolase domain-containing protein n=1 Tax=Paraburkholderia oxyphila TaxID=614212 RepID=UPI0005BA72D4|nr:serine hydrolase domain-containing protein [Paraburkholderia oxyphila]
MVGPEMDARIRALDDIFLPFNRSDAPGMVVGVAHHGRLLYRRGFGLANLEHAVANTPTTRMRIGSTSKQFTCLATLLLAEEGKLEVDASIRTYVPELPVLAGEPTFRQLMTHTGGYRCYLDLAVIGNAGAMLKEGKALSYQILQQDVNFPPGERMAYCNGGYHLLSVAVARASGMAFETFLKRRIFDPLGMRNTDSVPNDLIVVPRKATPYVRQPDGRYLHGMTPVEDMRGEGAIVSTVDDMLIWLAHLRGTKQIGNEASWAQMLTPATYSSGLVGTYCLGLARETCQGTEVIHHAGGVVGGASQMITLPKHELDIIVITNGAPANPDDLAWQIIERILGETLPGNKPPRARTSDSKGLVGHYWSETTKTLVEVVDEQGHLVLNWLNSIQSPVFVLEDGYGVASRGVGPLTFRQAPACQETGVPVLELTSCGHIERFARLPDVPPSAADFARGLTGTYVSHDLEAVASIRFDGTAVAFDMKGEYGGWTSDLQVIAPDIATSAVGPAVYGVPTVLYADRDEAGIAQGFWLSTPRSRNLRFVRTSPIITQD